jgi:DNA-binding NarL/FixJ family response regulator
LAAGTFFLLSDATTMTGSIATVRAPLRCLVVEDQTMFLQLLAGMLRTVPGIEVIGAVGTAREALACCRTESVDLLVLDLLLPDGHGIDLLRAAVELRPELVCIVLSSAAGECACPRPLLGNLRAVIDKSQAYERLQAVIADLVRSRGVTAAQPLAALAADPVAELRPREREVFELLGRGLTTADIAAQLGISPNTVETHRRNIVARLGARGAELVRLATIHNQTRIDTVERGF